MFMNLLKCFSFLLKKTANKVIFENNKINRQQYVGERSLARSEATSRSNTRRGPRGPSNTPEGPPHGVKR